MVLWPFFIPFFLWSFGLLWSPLVSFGLLWSGANVFRSFVAQEGDTEVKKEVSSVIFGSSVAAVGEPEHSPTDPGGLGSLGPMGPAI